MHQLCSTRIYIFRYAKPTCSHSTRISLKQCWNFEFFKQSMGTRNSVERAPARLHRLAKPISWNRFLVSLNVYKFRLWNRGHIWTSASAPIYHVFVTKILCLFCTHPLATVTSLWTFRVKISVLSNTKYPKWFFATMRKEFSRISVTEKVHFHPR